jgi:hypothetical protein
MRAEAAKSVSGKRFALIPDWLYLLSTPYNGRREPNNCQTNSPNKLLGHHSIT